jgi:aspartyl-tRNA(Asn)/glutamyl-tRNA(Gln) amidotransferase subunit A
LDPKGSRGAMYTGVCSGRLRNMATLDELARQLNTGAIRARDLVNAALDRIADPAGEGARAFIAVNADSARARADAIDRARATGQRVPGFAGIPMALKDLFDVAGEVTSAGSRLLKNQPPALRDAPVIARLRAAGFIFIGRNNMTEERQPGHLKQPSLERRPAGTSVYRRSRGSRRR